MDRRTIGIFVLALALLGCRKRQAAPVVSMAPLAAVPREAGAPRTELTLTPASPRLPAGQVPKVAVSIQNWSAHPLWINARLAVNAARAPENERELWFEIQRPDGSEVPFTCVPTGSPARDKDYTALAPNTALSATIPLDCHDWQPGLYRIVASYLDSNKTAPAPPAGAHAFGDLLVSAPVTVEIAP